MQDTEATYINNSGLVLTWPYLTFLFEKTGLVKNGEFIDSDTQHRAVGLLHYLIYAEMPQKDTGLELNKILCGMHPSYTMQLTNTVDTNWPHLRLEMWNALINNWEIVKNTSVDGLLESFVLRLGKMQSDTNNWQLKVEPKAIDVLLSKLPWSISTIKLQWMKTVLQTHWR